MSVVNNPLLSKPIGGILLSEQQQQHPEHHSKIKVGVRAFCGILEINDPEQFFENDFELYMHWEDPHLQVEDEAENGFIDLEKPPEWQPIVSFLNCTVQKELCPPEFQRRGKQIYAFYNWKIRILDGFYVKDFPFDRQILDIYFDIHHARLCQYDASKGIPDGTKTQGNCFVRYSDDMWKLEAVKSSMNTSADGLARCHIQIFISREPSFYLFNIVLVTFLIVFIALSVWALDVHDYSSRISVLMTTVLTVVAFKFVTINMVPAVPYLTLMDKYMLATFMVLTFIVIENVALATLDVDTARNVDDKFSLCVLVLWILIHILIFIGDEFDLFRTNWDNLACENDKIPQEKGCEKIEEYLN